MQRSAQLDARLCSVVAGDTLPRSSPSGVRRLGIDTGDQNLMTESRPILFDRLTWTRWRKVVSSFAGSPDAGRRAKVLFAALLGLLLAINGLNVVNSYVGRDFMTAIEQRSMSRLPHDGAALRRRLRGLDRRRGAVPLHRGAPRPALARVAHARARRALPARTQPTTGCASAARSRTRTSGSPTTCARSPRRRSRSCSCCSTRPSRSSRSRACCGRSARCCSAVAVAYAALGSGLTRACSGGR